jgi:uncharacterized damage-inducible protein DinB
VSGEPQPGIGGELAHVSAYLDFYRTTCIEKCRSLPVEELRVARVPSGWTALELLNHLALMERRWFVWGFLGEQVDEPWGDSRGDDEGRWHVADDRGLDEIVALLDEYAARTREILASAAPESLASPDGRFAGDEPPELRWICFHVLQEYARHAGHLDIVVELAGGHVGE